MDGWQSCFSTLKDKVVGCNREDYSTESGVTKKVTMDFSTVKGIMTAKGEDKQSL